jgi:hypothetical protein
MPDGLAYLLRTLRLEHFAMDGNVALPANIMFAAVKDPEMSDWWDHNQNVVLNPEVILGRDYTLAPGWKRKVQDMLRRRTGLSLEKWDGPWNEPRMRELGFESWTSRSYP